MEMEVVVPMGVNAPVDFNFDSNCSTPYMTAPSSPQRFGNLFFSAPTSPTRISPFFHQINDLPSSSVSSVLDHNNKSFGNDDDFEFNFSGNLERASLSAADELFDGGKIRALKPPPRAISPATETLSPKSRISQVKKKKAELETEKRDSDPLMEETHRRGEEQKRGRERVSCSSGRKGTRSLSPLRVSDIVCETEDKDVSSSTSNARSFLSFTKGSASEGRATDKDPLRKYEVLSKKGAVEEDVRISSFRSTESSGSVSKRRGPVSAHELHYTLNRAAAEEMKKKTPLPYKQGLLGCLGFNNH
ncbi:hypothetical protein SESBI_48325, partial [Sesbania bispinosa]